MFPCCSLCYIEDTQFKWIDRGRGKEGILVCYKCVELIAALPYRKQATACHYCGGSTNCSFMSQEGQLMCDRCKTACGKYYIEEFKYWIKTIRERKTH
jgi:hypothetical protein